MHIEKAIYYHFRNLLSQPIVLNMIQKKLRSFRLLFSEILMGRIIVKNMKKEIKLINILNDYQVR
ncbi:hypothetical protein D0466_14940 [Peribacillus glennii]|uniref:Uncharacterized protein n=1 Tax=Peribacillus glennii TaxID=2303991 RepID=A0A372LAX3_9BACI|nr:hypothetical protein D0466_14940 [Peribacillus glennii]